MAGLVTADARGFYDRWYAPNNAIVVIAGDVTLASVRPLAEKYYGAIPARAVPARARVAEPLQFAPRRVTLESAQVRQASWIRAYQAPSYHTAGAEHAYALQVLAQILGGDTTSRLYRRLVVEQKLAVGAGADYGANRLGISAFSLSATPPAGGKLDQLEAAMDKEVAGLLATGVTAGRGRARRRIAAGRGDQGRRQPRRPGPHHRRRARHRRHHRGRRGLARPHRPVTVDQVNAAAKAVFDINRSVTGLLLPKETS